MTKACFTASIIRNTPNAFLKAFAGNTAISKLNNAVEIRAGIINAKTPSVFKRPFCLCRGRTSAAIGRNAITLVAWASRCSTPKIKVKAGIKTVPPPIPIPPKIPAANPTNNNNIKDI